MEVLLESFLVSLGANFVTDWIKAGVPDMKAKLKTLWEPFKKRLFAIGLVEDSIRIELNEKESISRVHAALLEIAKREPEFFEQLRGADQELKRLIGSNASNYRMGDVNIGDGSKAVVSQGSNVDIRIS